MEDSFHVLLIEDDLNDAELVESELSNVTAVNYVVTHARCLADGIQLLRKECFDLVLLDLALPDSSGLDTFHRLRQELTQVPVVILSGATDATLSSKAVEAGAHDYMVKGLDTRPLSYSIERWRLEAITAAHAREQFAVAAMGQQLLIESNLDTLLDEVVALVSQTLDVEMSEVLELLPQGDMLRFRVGVGWRDGVAGGCLVSLSDLGGEEALRSPSPMVLAQLKTNGCLSGASLLDEHKVVSGMRVAVTAKNKPWGVLGAHTTKRRVFSQHELNFVQTLAHMLGQVIERKIAEAESRESSAEMAEAQRIAHVGSWELKLISQDDFKVNPLRWSDEMFRIAGYEPGSVSVSYDWALGLIPQGEQAAIERELATAIRERGEFTTVHRFIQPSGQERTVRETARLFFDEQTGVPLKVIGTAHDITDQRRTEEALRLQAQMLDQIGQAVIATDLDGRVLYANRFAGELYGWAPSEMLGRSIVDVTVPGTSREEADEIMATLKQGRSWSGEFVVSRRDGTTFPAWVLNSPLYDQDGELTGVIGISSDMTERKLAEERLTEQAALLEIANEAILVTDMEGRILYWNKGAERTYGWTALEAVGQNSIELLHEHEGAFGEARAALLAKGEWQAEAVKRTKIGKEIVVEVRCTLVDKHRGSGKAILAINTDVTDKKRIEGQLFRAQRMDSIGTLAGGIAHDLNNVLAPILMAVQILQEMIQEAECCALLSTVEASAQRGADLVKQVLSFARGVEGERVTVNPGHLLRDIEKIIRETFPKNITFKRSRPRDLWTVTGDPTQLHQVLINLAVNARDAMPNGGDLTVKLENVVVDESYAQMSPGSKPGSYVLMTVEDTGTGVPEDVREKVFEPFFTTKEIGKGTGLGLSTTLAIVKSHGGYIELFSEPGKGAEFKVYIPASEGAGDQEIALEQQEVPRGCGQFILVVDDEETIRSTTTKALTGFGYVVQSASNGAEGVAVYAQHRNQIAAVLVDMAMPVMDGPATIAALEALNPAVKIIACSGHTTGKAMGMSVKCFLSKPYSLQALLAALQNVLNGGSERGAGAAQPSQDDPS